MLDDCKVSPLLFLRWIPQGRPHRLIGRIIRPRYPAIPALILQQELGIVTVLLCEAETVFKHGSCDPMDVNGVRRSSRRLRPLRRERLLCRLRRSAFEVRGYRPDSFRYQSMVFRRPSSNPVRALKPNSLSALDTSNILLGCPSGFVLSHTTGDEHAF
jgi:hypothetical protein